MIRVAVCDDDKFICDSIKEHILKYSIKRNEEFETMTFKSCEELMVTVKSSTPIHPVSNQV